jgi:hypothetical protein
VIDLIKNQNNLYRLEAKEKLEEIEEALSICKNNNAILDVTF